jgi:hypothetical protein
MNHYQKNYTPTSTGEAVSTITATGNLFPNSNNPWDNMALGSRIGIIISIIIGLVAIALFSIYFCFGGRAKWKRQSQAQEAGIGNGSIPLHAVNNRGANEVAAGRGGDAPPPRYEEVVPAQHQTLAGGIQHVRPNDEEEGIISDGKTPLSEIPFEDVVFDQGSSSSGSSPSQAFASTHHLGGGDTTGHTNT